MQLHLNAAAGQHLVRQVDDTHVHLNSGPVAGSILLCPTRGPRVFPAVDATALEPSLFADILADAPDVLLIGTGRRIRFPSVEVRAQLLARRIGVEVMDNAACARTFNVLAGEGRSVMAIFLLGGAA